MKSSARSLLYLALVPFMLAAGMTHAAPQMGRSVEEQLAAQERKERKEKKDDAQASQQAQEQAPSKYPQASRQEPEERATAKFSPQLKVIFDAYERKDFPVVVAGADQIIADSEANAYEHAVAARLAGVTQLNTDNAKALTYFQKAIEFNGLTNNEHYEAMLLVAQIQQQAKQYEQSQATLDRFMSETKTQEPEQLALKGNNLYRLKRLPEAATALEQAIKASPEAPAQWKQLLMGIYSDMGRTEEAAKMAESATTGQPNDKQGQLNLASTYMQSGQDDKAAEVLEKLRTSGELTEAQDYKNLYAIYSNAGGKEAQVITVIRDGLDKGILKQEFHTYNALAQAYWFSDKPNDAIEAYKVAAPLAPDGETYLNLARALKNADRQVEAREAARQALAKGVKKPEDANRIIGGK